MDALAKLFSFFASTGLWQTVISIVAAAIVFFYSIYLLRKEEAEEQADAESASADISAELSHQA